MNAFALTRRETHDARVNRPYFVYYTMMLALLGVGKNNNRVVLVVIRNGKIMHLLSSFLVPIT